MSKHDTRRWFLPVLLAIGLLGMIPGACMATGSSGLEGDDDDDGQGAQGAQAGQGGQAGTGGMGWGNSGVGGGTIGPFVTLTGRVMAPNGIIPVSGALVFVTQTVPEPIPTGAYHYECDDMTGVPYTLSNADGTWTIEDVSAGTWNLVTRKGNFRRVREIEVADGMDPEVPEETTTLPGANTPDGMDSIPSYAVVKTSPDLTYNLLAKFGLGQVDASGELLQGTETFSIYEDSGYGPYPHTAALFDSQDTLNSYHMVFLPCYASSVGVAFVNNHVQMLRDYVSVGGRIYNTCTVSLWTEAPFPEYIDFYQSDDPDRFDIGRSSAMGYTTTGTVLDPDLAAWMNAATSINPNSVPFQNGYVTIVETVEVDDGHGLESDDFVVKPYTWVQDNDNYPGSPLMVTYHFDYGKVFYSVYETSAPSMAINPQEYVLLYVILEVGVCSNPPEPPE